MKNETKTKKPTPKDWWEEFLTPTLCDIPKTNISHIMNGKSHLCGLCGNTGVISIPDGLNVTPVGYPVKGVNGFCICRSGRSMKRKGFDLTTELEVVELLRRVHEECI